MDQWPAGTRLFNSWILFLGFLPIDLHFFFLRSITPGVGFEESSSSIMNERWDHTRWVTPNADGCLVTDRVQYQSRLPFVGAVLLPVYRAIFESRHRYLRRTYGTTAG